MNLTYEKAASPRPAWVVRLDGKIVGITTRTKGGQWLATPTTISGAARITVPACETRHEATMALIGRLAEANLI